MSDTVTVPEKTTENAVLLLAAAEELGLGPEVVRTTEDGFVVSKEIHDKAFGDKKSPAKKSSKKE